jgi:hypothetical protein
MLDMAPIRLIVYPVKAFTAAKRLFGTILGAEPYVHSAYYVGYWVEEI